MIRNLPRLAELAAIACLALLSGCEGCQQVDLSTIELRPVSLRTGNFGKTGSKGWCLSRGNPPPSPFSDGPNRILVGYDNFFKKGTNPFPCDDIRVQIFRGGVLFDLAQFDVIGTAELLFDVVASVARPEGAATPPASFATTLGIATQAFTEHMLFDEEVMLPGGGPSFVVGVSSQVRDWITNARPNFGFVIAGPLMDLSTIPNNNDARLSWYGNFRLRVLYNPALNPRAPQ